MLSDDIVTLEPSEADAVMKTVLRNAAQRAKFFEGPSGWIAANAPGRPDLLEAYAGELMRELETSPAVRDKPEMATLPTWLLARPGNGGVLVEDGPAGEIRMVAVAVAAGAAVVTAACAVVTAVTAVTTALGVASSTTPPHKGPPPNPQ